jgi:hypothetical protein
MASVYLHGMISATVWWESDSQVISGKSNQASGQPDGAEELGRTTQDFGYSDSPVPCFLFQNDKVSTFFVILF